MGTAEDPAVRLDAVSDDLAPAVLARRREGVNRALEAVERVRRALDSNLEGLVVVVSADLAARHTRLILVWAALREDTNNSVTILEFRVRTAELSPEAYVVSVDGELDLHTAPELEQAFDAILARGGRSVVVDLVGLEFIDSAALATMLRALPRFRSRGGRFLLVTEDRRILRTLEITGLDQTFDIEPRLGSAVGRIMGGAVPAQP